MEGELTPSNQMEGHEFTVWSLSITPDGQRIVSGGQDATIRLWDFATGREIHRFIGHDGPIYGLVIMPDGKRLVSIADRDLSVRIWDLEKKEMRSSLAPNSVHVTCVAVSPDQRFIVTGGDDGLARYWDLDRGVLLRTSDHEHGIYKMLVSPDGRYLLSGSKRVPGTRDPGVVWIWDFELGVLLRTLEGHNGHVTALSMTADSRYILSGDQDGVVRLWDLETGTLLKTMTGHHAPILTIHITADSQHVITGSTDGTVRVWVLRGGVLLANLKHTENIHSMTVTPDGSHVITGSMDGLVEIWDFERDSIWIDTSKERAEEARAELEAFRMVQMKKITTRYETLPLDRLTTLLRFKTLEELEDWLLELPPEIPVKIDGPDLVIKKEVS
ncbi:MAG: WD40 repeat domain-containing protein [Candidatus Thorarchaeota archaeon]|nr:WD40 repeat domain-containing protein [Candidatus Thorarchaeota archaeon]